MRLSAWMAVAVLGMATGAMAQNQPSGPNPGVSAGDRMVQEQLRAHQEQLRKQEEAAAARLLSVNFPGGTIGQYVEALRKASSGGSANIVMSERSSKVPLSAINLKNVDIGVAVSAIPAAYSGARGVWHIEPVTPSGGSRIANFESATVTFSVDFESLSDYQTGELKVESFSLGRLLNPAASAKPDSDPGAVLTAIETGLHLLIGDAVRRPELKYHPDSSLLFVRGSVDEISLVKSIILRMTEEAVRRQAITQRRTHAEQVRKLQVKEAMLRVQVKELELQAVSGEMERMKQQAEAGAASATEVARLQLEVGRAQMNVEMAKIELERTQLMSPEETPEPSGSEGANLGNTSLPAPPSNVNPGVQPGRGRPGR